MKPRVLFVSRGPYELPLDDGLRRKWDALREVVDFRVLAVGVGSGPNGDFRLLHPTRVLDGPAFYARLPFRVAAELRRFEPHVVVAQGAHETAAVLAARRAVGSKARVIADVHGDWRAPTRLYGSRLRGMLSPLADRVAESALRHVDAVRTVSDYTTGLVRRLGVDPADEFPAYMDFTCFLASKPVPLPERPQVLFVGVLERYKNVDGLAKAWRKVAPRIPGAHLRVVGRGTLSWPVMQLVADLPEQTTWTSRLAQPEIAAALDESTLLVLPSRSEGMGRVVVEAFCRGRGVVGSRVGGIPDLVEHDASGLLIEPGDTDALAEALFRVLSDRPLAERLGAGAYAQAPLWTISPAQFADRIAALAQRVLGAACGAASGRASLTRASVCADRPETKSSPQNDV